MTNGTNEVPVMEMETVNNHRIVGINNYLSNQWVIDAHLKSWLDILPASSLCSFALKWKICACILWWKKRLQESDIKDRVMLQSTKNGDDHSELSHYPRTVSDIHWLEKY